MITQPVLVHWADTVPSLPLTHAVLVFEQVWPSAVLPHCAIHLTVSSHGTCDTPVAVAHGGGGGAAGGHE
jgi:hypothetical protein